MRKKTHAPSMESASMRDAVLDALEDARGLDVKVLDVRNLTDITDYMIISTGTSDRHVKTLSDRVLEFMRGKNCRPFGLEGEESMNWILVDFIDVVVHIMRDSTRRHYDLESLWSETFAKSPGDRTADI